MPNISHTQLIGSCVVIICTALSFARGYHLHDHLNFACLGKSAPIVLDCVMLYTAVAWQLDENNQAVTSTV